MYPKLSEINSDIMQIYLESMDSPPPKPNPKISISTIVLSIIFVPIAIIFIFLGSYSIDLCSKSPNLPYWMIFLGCFMLIDRGVAWILELNIYCFKKENPKTDREMKALIDWESKKAGHRIRISNHLSMTISGLIFFGISGCYLLSNVIHEPESGQCTNLLILPSAIFCALTLVSSCVVLFFSFIILIYLLGLKCLCS